MSKASKPTAKDDSEYHLHTKPGQLSPLCLMVGAPGRVRMIGEKYLEKPDYFQNSHRGLVSCTGKFHDEVISVVTHGMGGASAGIIFPEAVRCGARVLIRVGSCGSLIRKSKPGDSIIVTGAIRFDGASDNWAPLEFPAVADWRVVAALVRSARQIVPEGYYTGIECTTSDFNQGQGRPGFRKAISEKMRQRHQEVLRLGVACYSMEAASLFTWCAAEAGGLPCGTINAIYGNRITEEWNPGGDEQASLIALKALVSLSADKTIKHFMHLKF